MPTGEFLGGCPAGQQGELVGGRRAFFDAVGADGQAWFAGQLDQAILIGLLDTFARTDLAQQATRAIRSQASDARDRAEGELAAIRSEIDQAEAAIKRYLGTFEAGTLPEAQCGKRVQALGAKLAELRARELELQQALAASAAQEPPTPADLDELASQLRQAVEHAPVTAKKALAQQLVHEIHVASRDDIRPIFRIPTRQEPSPGEGEKVRKLVGSVRLTGLEPATSTSGAWRSLRAELQAR
jgi:hypothetical protein